MATTSSIKWTNKSVRAFAQANDPIKKITDAARALVLKARESGWDGPPFNPLFIAELLDIPVSANSSIADARLLATDDGPLIEFNPQQARERVRFSIAHEIAHLLFPDWNELIRNRAELSSTKDNWQLEMLCNLAASEFVMPIGSLPAASEIPPIESLMLKRRTYDVSAEAFLLRLVKVTTSPTGMFVASPIHTSMEHRSYKIDYFVSSPIISRITVAQHRVPLDSIVHHCTAIGHTDSAIENWIIGTPTIIECVGIPGYPGSSYPRVIGLVRADQAIQSLHPIRVVHGDIFRPRGSGPKILCQMVNDRATKWGGGVARKMASRYPDAETSFAGQFVEIPRNHRLGTVVFAKATEDITVASLIAQEGFGRSLFPRIRYRALAQCLETISTRALNKNESVHMPKIGTGVSGGDWLTIEELLDDTFVRAGVPVTVYELPPKRPQLELF